MDDTGIRRIIGPTICLASGAYYDFENPEGSTLSLADIAHGLSNICRFTGQCVDFYSVAEHSVHCSYLVPPADALAALLHDAAEAVLGDVSRPLKSLLPEYKSIEKRVERAVLAEFGLPETLPESVKLADRQMLAIEQLQCMGSQQNWGGLAAPQEIVALKFWSPREARLQFRLRYAEIMLRQRERKENP